MGDLRRMRGLRKAKPSTTKAQDEKPASKPKADKKIEKSAKSNPDHAPIRASVPVDKIIEDCRLNQRKSQFVKEFLKDFSAEKAALRANYSDRKYGHRLIKEEGIKNAIQMIIDTNNAHQMATPDYLAGQMAIYAMSNMADYFDIDNNFIGFGHLTREQSSCIKSFSKEYDKEGRPKVKIQLYEADKANERLGKMHQLYVEPKIDANEFDGMTKDQIIERVRNNIPQEVIDLIVGDKDV